MFAHTITQLNNFSLCLSLSLPVIKRKCLTQLLNVVMNLQLLLLPGREREPRLETDSHTLCVCVYDHTLLLTHLPFTKTTLYSITFSISSLWLEHFSALKTTFSPLFVSPSFLLFSWALHCESCQNPSNFPAARVFCETETGDCC